MPARVMLSSVTKDDVPLGNVGALSDIWYQATHARGTVPVRGARSQTDHTRFLHACPERDPEASRSKVRF